MNRKWSVIVGGWALVTLLNMALLPRRYAPSVEVEILAQQPMPLMVRASGNLEAKDSNTIKIQFEANELAEQFRQSFRGSYAG